MWLACGFMFSSPHPSGVFPRTLATAPGVAGELGGSTTSGQALFSLLLSGRIKFQFLGAVVLQRFLRSWEFSQGTY